MNEMNKYHFLRRVVTLACLLALLAIPAVSGMGAAASPAQDYDPATSDTCPPLPPPAGEVVTVSTVTELQNAVNNATSNTTISIADGTYNLDGVYIRLDTPHLTLRSASGNREAVILNGNYVTTEIIQIVASDVTIADLTLREAHYHPIHVMSTDAGDTENTAIYNVHIIDPREQAIKINPGTAGYYPDDGLIACSHIELTDTGRPHVNPIAGGCYTGGVDAHQAQGWVIRDNLIEGFWCENGLSEHGIHLWRGCRDTLVERNVLRDNARGIGFGLASSGEARTYPDNPCPGAGGGYVDHYDGFIRNNFVFASRDALFSSEYGFDCGVCLWQACGAQVLHNTVASTQAPFSSVEWRFSNTDVDIINNLVSHNLRDRGGSAYLAGNLEDAPLSLFVDGTNGDLHLAASASSAIDQGVTLAGGLCDDDIDGDPRPIGSARDIGADEYGTPPPAAVTDLRVTHAVTGSGTLTGTLRWTAPTDAVTYSLRHSSALINETNWASAATISVPFAATPGSTEWLTAPVSYTGDPSAGSGHSTVYFALKSQNAEGVGSGLSNNAFWPHFDVYLPLIMRACGP